MDISAELHGKTVVFTLAGRFDSFGAKEAREAVNRRLTPDIVCAVLDLEKVGYISSAGVRILAMASRTLRERGGIMVLCGVGGYCREVLETSGLARVFPMSENREEALALCAEAVRDKESLDHWEFLERISTDSGTFRFVPGSEGKGEILVLGGVQRVLEASISRETLYSRTITEAGYSIGLGGLGPSAEDCFGIMGEMVSVGGTMVWMPSDGNAMPDFLIQRSGSPGITMHAGFNVSILGGFNEGVMFESVNPAGTPLGEICRSLFALSRKRRPDYKGILGLAAWLEVGELYGSYLKRSPIADFRPENGQSILAPVNVDQWLHVDRKPLYKGATCLMCGVGADLSFALSGYQKDLMDAVFYTGPDTAPGRDDDQVVLHNHGVVFSNVAMPERMACLEAEIGKVVMKGDFRDMRHLMDATTVTRGFFGLSYTRLLRRDQAETVGAGEANVVARRLAAMRYGVR